LNFRMADDQKMILAYERVMSDEEIIVVFNRSDSVRKVSVPVKFDGDFIDVLSDIKRSFKSRNREIILRLEPITGIVLKRKI
jgi:hypothetical protein